MKDVVVVLAVVGVVGSSFVGVRWMECLRLDKIDHSLVALDNTVVEERRKELLKLDKIGHSKAVVVAVSYTHLDVYKRQDLSIVQNFVGAAETIIKQGGKIAVHCKAGLGRTGCLIGAHMIYTYGFTANECIGFLRFMRPGMVVGPQQHWLYLNQNTFREWKYTMRLSQEPSDAIGGLYPLITVEEYKLQKRKKKAVYEADYTQDDHTMTPPSAAKKTIVFQKNSHAAVPQQSPGQPRKGQDGNTIEDINKKENQTVNKISDNNSDLDDSMNAENSVKNTSNDARQIDNSSMEDANALKQVLPKNRRLASSNGKRTTSGVRKISSSKR